MKKSLLAILAHAFLFLFFSCQQFKTVDGGQPVVVDFMNAVPGLDLEPGDTVKLYKSSTGWAVAEPDAPDSVCIRAIFVK